MFYVHVVYEDGSYQTITTSTFDGANKLFNAACDNPDAMYVQFGATLTKTTYGCHIRRDLI